MARINISQILFKRGNTAASMSYTGPVGEVVIDTDLDAFRIQDGQTPGGRLMASTRDFANITANLGNLTSSITTLTGIDANFVANINVLLSNAATQQTTINTLLANAAVQSVAIGNLQAFQTYANATFGTSSYGNANVESYFGANVGSLWSNAATQATGINTITANLGAYQTWANANAATQAGSISTLQTQVYTNANVATYLPTYSGNIAANIVKNGYTWNFLTDGTLTLPASSGQIGRSGYTNGIDLYNNNGGTGYVRMNYADESFVWADSGGSHIQTTGGTWDFGTDGTTTLPAGGVIAEGGGLTGAIRLTPAGGANANQALVIYPTAAGDGDHVHLTSGGGATELYLGDDSHYVKLANGGNVEIRTDDLSGNVGIWNFGTDGNLTLPQSGYLQVSGGIVPASFTASPAPVISGFSTISAERFTFLANGVNILSTVTGNYGNANVASYLPTYSGNIAANIVKNGYTWTFGNTGTTTFPTGVRLSNARGANTVNFLTDVDKSFQIETQTSATSKLWNFTTDGNLTLPQNANINFSNGVNILTTVAGTYSNANVASYLTTATITTTGNVTAGNISGSGLGLTGVALKTTGSWTVTTGTNTYSFTVPVNGVYQLWIECNIPNGILAYQATATVTNSNVPVVGAQYAWVYTGGGTPIDFTSIPNQFTGTGNTIVRSNTAPSATTNRFDFGINNTSGSSQTVQWGYVRID